MVRQLGFQFGVFKGFQLRLGLGLGCLKVWWLGFWVITLGFQFRGYVGVIRLRVLGL